MMTLALSSFVLSAILALLCWLSQKHQGLGEDTGSGGQLFVYRYTPTIVAVLFTQAIVKIADDVKSTVIRANVSFGASKCKFYAIPHSSGVVEVYFRRFFSKT